MYICEGDVLSAQKHITQEDLDNSWVKYRNNKTNYNQ